MIHFKITKRLRQKDATVGTFKHVNRHRPGLFILLLLLLCSPSWAATGGSISGSVADRTGALIPNAIVLLRNSETNTTQSCATNSEGGYSFAVPAAGTFDLEVSYSGFKPFQQAGIRLDSGAVMTLNINLEVLPNRETVTVVEDGAALDTSGSEAGERISEAKIAAAPLNGRGYTDLLAIQPGVMPASSQQPNAVVMAGAATTPPSGDLNAGNVSISGQRETTNAFYVDGSSVEEAFNMGAALVPNLDSIQEFRVVTNNADAEYGNYSGGQVIVVTKSGTNQLHGSAFDFVRNTALDARNFFSPERAKFNRNQFGGTLGGPIKRNKVFVFGDYQGTRMAQGIETGLIPVPSLADRNGDLSDITSSLTGKVNGQYWANLLSQRLGYTVSPGEPYFVPGCTSSSQCVLPNAQIPQSAWSAPAQHLLPYIPAPNQTGNTFSSSSGNQELRDDKASVRIDAATRLGSVAAYYTLDDFFENNPYPTQQGGANVPGFNAISQGRAQLVSLGVTKTFGSSALNEFHFSYLRFANNVGQPVGGVGPKLSEQGFVEGPGTLGIVPLAPKIEGVENIVLNDFTFGVDVTGEAQVNNTYQWSDNFSRVVGKHTLKFGGALHLDQINVNPDAVFNGSFQFEGTETGSDFADFLLGIASYYRQGDSKSFYLRSRYLGLFGQDSWQVRPSLTLNLGLRWDVLPPWYEKYNQIQTLVLGEQSVVYPEAPKGLVFPGDPGIPRTLAPAKYTNFAPRLGLAYSPNFQTGLLGRLLGSGKTSVRAGYGVFYTAFEGLSAGIMSANPPYGYDYDSSTIGPPLFETPFVAAATGQTLGQPFPSPIPAFGASASNPNSSVNWSKYEPITGVPAFFFRNVPPYAENYTASVQRQLGQKTVVSVSYVGTQAHQLLVLISANPGNPALCLETPSCGPFSETGVRGPFGQQFDAITYQKTIGNSNYNSLEASVRHSAGSFEFLIGYTYSKSIDQSSSLAEPVNPIDPNLSRAISAFDMRHNFVASYRYELPIAHLFRNHDRLMKGWTISGITRFSSGFPVTLFNNKDTSLLGTIPNGINNNGIDTPDVTPGNLEINNDPRNGLPAFNTSLFSLPALGRMGTARRRFFYGPGINNFDLALQKTLVLTEAKVLEFRVEAFNAFNHAQFYGPTAVDGDIGSKQFGRIVTAADPRLVQMAIRFQF